MIMQNANIVEIKFVKVTIVMYSVKNVIFKKDSLLKTYGD